VDLQADTDVSEEHTASMFRAEDLVSIRLPISAPGVTTRKADIKTFLPSTNNILSNGRMTENNELRKI
jgi:hypothetical protein